MPVTIERAGDAVPAAPAAETEQRWRNLGIAVRDGDVRRLALALLLASVGVTLSDFVFKAAVSQAVPVPHLGAFLASAYFAFDLASLLLLLVAVGPAVRWLGAPMALAIRPFCLLIGGAAGRRCRFPVAMALRGVDGTAGRCTRPPASCCTCRWRRAARGGEEISDLLAQRGGQALGSLLILICLTAAAPTRWIGGVVMLCAAAWI